MDARDADGTNAWADIIGECYTAESLARTLGWTEADVAEATKSLRLLALQTTDGPVLYPRFQLQDGHVMDTVEDVLRVLRAGIDDPWTWAQWLTAPTRQNDGQEGPTRIDEIRSGHLGEVLLEAKNDAAVWGS